MQGLKVLSSRPERAKNKGGVLERGSEPHPHQLGNVESAVSFPVAIGGTLAQIDFCTLDLFGLHMVSWWRQYSPPFCAP